MIHVFSEAKDFCAEHVSDGLASSDPKVASTLNEATMMMMQKPDLYKHLIQKLKINTYYHTIALPHNAEAALAVGFCDQPANIHGMWYEFLEGGPGIFHCGCNGYSHDLVDQGDGFPTFFPIGCKGPLPVVAFSKDAADIGKTLRVQGFNSSYEEVNPTTPGELISVHQWRNGVEGDIDFDNTTFSTNSFQQINAIIKEETTDYVTLMAYDSSNGSYYTLAKYLPKETHPGYRRYKITDTTLSTLECVTMLVKMRYVPLKYDQDVLPIQNLVAYKWMCKAIHAYNQNDMAKGAELEAFATRKLNEQLASYHLGGPAKLNVRIDHGFGSDDVI